MRTCFYYHFHALRKNQRYVAFTSEKLHVAFWKLRNNNFVIYSWRIKNSTIDKMYIAFENCEMLIVHRAFNWQVDWMTHKVQQYFHSDILYIVWT